MYQQCSTLNGAVTRSTLKMSLVQISVQHTVHFSFDDDNRSKYSRAEQDREELSRGYRDNAGQVSRSFLY
jgi:hypothetical protein